MPSTIPPPQIANRISPRDILVSYQLRRENRALLDAFEQQKRAQRLREEQQEEARRLREEEIERKILLVDQQHKQKEEQMKDEIKELGQRLVEYDGYIRGIEHGVREIEATVVQQLSARLPSATFTAMANGQDDESQQLPRSSPPLLRREQRRVPSPAQPQSAPAAFVSPHQRYPLRRGANAAAAPAGPSSAPNAATTTTAEAKENVGTRANLSRKRSIPAPSTPVAPAPPATAPATRARSVSTSSTLSTVPSSHADGDDAEPEIPDLPFTKRGTPTQGDLDVDIYFAAAVKFARERRVHEESEDDQMTFILQIFKGMKKEERTEVVAALEEASLAKTDTKRRTVQFLALWNEIAEACDKEVLMEAKAKAILMRATAVMDVLGNGSE